MPDTTQKIPLTATMHLRVPDNPLGPAACGERWGGFTSTPGEVTCFACRKSTAFQAARQPMPLAEVVKDLPVREQLRRRWTVAVVGGDTDSGFTDWLNGEGVGNPTPTLNIPNCHRPPVMNDNGDGVFRFHDVFIEGCTLEAVPQQSGNVEIAISYGPGDGYTLTLCHLDRMDLVRALLHDFHYSPERGGPNEDV